jgi:hypothetical protein
MGMRFKATLLSYFNAMSLKLFLERKKLFKRWFRLYENWVKVYDLKNKGVE